MSSITSHAQIGSHSIMESMIMALDQSSADTQENVRGLEAATSVFQASATEMNERLVTENMRLQALVSDLQGQQTVLVSTHATEVNALSHRLHTVTAESDIQRRTNELLQQQVNVLAAEISKFKAQEDYNKTPAGVLAAFEASRRAYHQLPEAIRSAYQLEQMNKMGW